MPDIRYTSNTEIVQWVSVHDQLPEPDRVYMVTGPSGYNIKGGKFLVNAFIDSKRRLRHENGELFWYDATGTLLSDCGWTPTHFGEMIRLP